MRDYKPGPENAHILEVAMALARVDADLIAAREEESQKVTALWQKKIRKAIAPLIK